MNDRTQAAELARRSGPAAVPLALVRPAEAAAGVAEEQLAYANLLDIGMKVGFLSLLATFAAYLAGVFAPHVPVSDLPRYWAMPVKAYLAATGVRPGWGWIHMLDKGDFLTFVGIALLSGVTIICYLSIIPIFLKKGNRVYGALSLVEVLVLALAASGLLAAGGH